ncbi:MAG: serine/threonine protein kinase [Sandaracinaceae bacterium]|nr:serine/threonine protein kinase [Sandaracinaceae bacterium]
MVDPIRDSTPGDSGLDYDDGEMESTTLGVDLFKTEEVPVYPAVARLGRYDILGRLARGGMAEVYLARAQDDDGTVRHVVLKRVLMEMQHDPQMLQMFLEEGRTALRLFHPNVCHVYEVGESNGLTYMVLEWVHGTSLRELVRRAKAQSTTLPLPLAVHIIAKVASALDYVHNARGLDGKPLSIIHQDVTPHNVMLSWKGQVKLLDFGIAKTSVGEGAGAPQGKYEYMSPEQVRGEAIDPRADVFALGVCLYEVLTGASLYQRDSVPQTMTAIVEEPVPSVRTARKDIPEALDRIVMRALAKKPKDRFATAGEMQRALEDWLGRNGGPIADVRLALTVGGYFNAAEKQPLPKHAAQFTGTFAALTGAKSSRDLDVEVDEPEWAQGFDHKSQPPPSSTSLRTGRMSPSIVDRFFELSPVVAFLLTLGVGGALLFGLIALYYVLR